MELANSNNILFVHLLISCVPLTCLPNFSSVEENSSLLLLRVSTPDKLSYATAPQMRSFPLSIFTAVITHINIFTAFQTVMLLTT